MAATSPASSPSTAAARSQPGALPTAAASTSAAKVEARTTTRLWSLDAYRGLIMLTLAANGFGLAAVASKFPDSSFWKFIHFQFEHPDWLSHVPWTGIGCSYWDLIQPSFMFMVGVAMPFSYARRTEAGESFWLQARHAAIRSVVLILMGVFLSSAWSQQTNWTLVNVLTQIGLGYFFVFCLLRCPAWGQILVGALLLVAYWWYFIQFSVEGASGYADHFLKHTNAAAHFDAWLLNLFPRPEPFTQNSGGYATLNFVPSMGTMLLGVMAGQLLRGPQPANRKLWTLVIGGAVCMAVGLAAGYTVCPIVKRIWTPSWTLFSGAYTLWILAAFYWFADVRGHQRWTFPLVIFGTNSLLVYVMGQLLRGWTGDQIKIHFGRLPWPFSATSETLREYLTSGIYGPILQSLAVTLVFWLICLWLYRQRVFLRV